MTFRTTITFIETSVHASSSQPYEIRHEVCGNDGCLFALHDGDRFVSCCVSQKIVEPPYFFEVPTLYKANNRSVSSLPKTVEM